MHCGLKLCSTSVLYPLVFCIYNIIAIIDGLIYFNQGDRLSSLHAGLIALGTVILLAGVVCLSWRLEDNEEEPTSPVASKHGRIQLPQTALQPGLGLAHSHSLDEPASPLHLDEEASAGQKPFDERTPLLAKTPKASALSLVNAKKRAMEAGGQKSPQLNTPRKSSARQRMTLSEETNEIWAELNDRGTLPSPARQSVDLERRPRSGTLPPRRNTAQSPWLNHMRRRSWFEGLGSRPSRSVSQGKQPADSTSPLLNHPDSDDGETSDADIMESSSRRRTWGYGNGQASKSQEALGDWLKLKWWRKKWREGEGHDGQGEEEEEGRRI